jgi:hypothetical protein
VVVPLVGRQQAGGRPQKKVTGPMPLVVSLMAFLLLRLPRNTPKTQLKKKGQATGFVLCRAVLLYKKKKGMVFFVESASGVVALPLPKNTQIRNNKNHTK